MLWNTIGKQGSYFPGNKILNIILEPKAAHSCDKIGNKLFFFGGWNGRAALDTLESFDLITEEWMNVDSSGEKPTARNNHASCSLNEYIYIHGGHDGEYWLDDFYILDIKKFVWKRILLSQYFPKARACHTLSRIGRKLYMYGGLDSKESFGDLEIFDVETQIWTKLDLKKKNISNIKIYPNPRSAHSAAVFNKKIYIYGGHFKNDHHNDLVIFDSLTNKWEFPDVKGMIPNGIRGHSATWIFGKLYIFGGNDGCNRKNDVYRLTPIQNVFKFIKINNDNQQILARQKHSAAIRNNKIIFFGGFDGNRWLNSLEEINIPLIESNILNEFSKNVLKNDLRFLLNNKEYSDIIFVVENEIIHAHKSILFARSEFFGNMFSDFMIENKSNVIYIDLYKSTTFMNLLEYLYCSEIRCKNIEDILDLYKLSDSYSIESLKKICEEMLSFMINVENVVEILILSFKCNSTVLEKNALEYFKKNRKEINKTGKMDSLIEYPSLMVKILINL